MARNLPDLWRRTSHDLWSPFREMSRMQRNMDRLFNEYVVPWEYEDQPPMMMSPACNFDETDSHYLISLDLPGINKEDVKIEMQDNQLVISGERKEEKRDEKVNRHSIERFYGSFMRAFALPNPVDPDKIEAAYKDGVLKIAVPKSVAVKPRQIRIGESSQNIDRLMGPKEVKKEKAA